MVCRKERFPPKKQPTKSHLRNPVEKDFQETKPLNDLVEWTKNIPWKFKIRRSEARKVDG